MQREQPKEYVTARVPKSIKERLDEIAVLERRSLSQVIVMLLESALNERNGKKGTK